MRYEVTVCDDGWSAVRKVERSVLWENYLSFEMIEDLKEYLIMDLDIRWEWEEVRGLIESAGICEWVEFK